MRQVLRFAEGLMFGWLVRADAVPRLSRKVPEDVLVCGAFPSAAFSDVLVGFVLFVVAAHVYHLPMVRNVALWAVLAFMAMVAGVGFVVTVVAGAVAGVAVGLGHRCAQQADGRSCRQDGRDQNYRVGCPTIIWWVRFGVGAAVCVWLPSSPPSPELVSIALPFLDPCGQPVQDAKPLHCERHGEYRRESGCQRQHDETCNQTGGGAADQHEKAFALIDVFPMSGVSAERSENTDAPETHPSTDDDTPWVPSGKKQEACVPCFMHEEGKIRGDPEEQAFEDYPLDEWCNEDPFPTWQVFAYTVLRYATIFLSVSGAARLAVLHGWI